MILTDRNSRARIFVAGLITAMSIMLFIFFIYILTDSNDSTHISYQSDHSSMTLGQYAMSPIPVPVSNDYLGSR
jgi:hypothetical protein